MVAIKNHKTNIIINKQNNWNISILFELKKTRAYIHWLFKFLFI